MNAPAPLLLVPFVPGMLHRDVLPAIVRDGLRPWPVDVSGDEFAYWRLLRGCWRLGRPLLIVEQDNVPHPGALRELLACPRPWCAYSYPVAWGGIAETYGAPIGLGCVRYSVELQDAHPALLAADVPTYRGGGRDGRSWRVLDAALAQWLRGPYGTEPHRHYPDVEHRHTYRR